MQLSHNVLSKHLNISPMNLIFISFDLDVVLTFWWSPPSSASPYYDHHRPVKGIVTLGSEGGNEKLLVSHIKHFRTFKYLSHCYAPKRWKQWEDCLDLVSYAMPVPFAIPLNKWIDLALQQTAYHVYVHMKSLS